MKSSLKFLILITALLVGIYLYKNIIPSYFPLQQTISQNSLNGNYNVNEEEGVFHGQKAISYEVSDPKFVANVLGDKANKRIEIDLTNQRLYAFEGNKKVFDFIISSGLYDWTPRGTFRIWIKLKYTKMAGGSKALGTYYYLPNVPFVMYFANNEIPRYRGFGIHGTYWHNDFGRPKSHGCINLRTEDAQKLYYWADPDLNGKNSIGVTEANPGTLITIYGKYKG